MTTAPICAKRHNSLMINLLDLIRKSSRLLLGTSKNPTRHAELVSASPLYQGIADHVRNDDCAKSVVFRSPLLYLQQYSTDNIFIHDETVF